MCYLGLISIQLTFTAMGFVGQEIQVETEKKKQLVCPAVRGRGKTSKTERGRAVRENQDGGVQKPSKRFKGD